MNTIWSEYVQKAETLYKTRTIRFGDDCKAEYMRALGFGETARILEVGCGPGALCFTLKRWYPGADITGVDRDSTFIRYARQKSSDLTLPVHFMEGDALSLPYPDSGFDATVSHTVVEHVETGTFFSEQHRILKPGGVCTVLSARTGMAVNPESWKRPSAEEKALMDKTDPYFKDSFKRFDICGYPLTEQQLPAAMEAAGFRQVSTHYVAVSQTPDSADVPGDTALAIIEANRQVALDCSALAQALAPGVLTEPELQRWRELVNERFDRRAALYQSGEKLWDTQVSVIMVVRGVKS